jgi:hypothetical protein
VPVEARARRARRGEAEDVACSLVE